MMLKTNVLNDFQFWPLRSDALATHTETPGHPLL